MASKLRSGLGCVLLGVALACGGNDAATPEPQAQKTAEAESALPSSAPNEAPVIDSLRLEPADPQPGDRLTARVESSDPDGDAVQLSYEWRIDGTRSRDRGHSLRVDEGVSSIEVRVTASDPEGASDRDHALVYVANRPPEIVGVVIEPAGEATALRDLLASPRASDPDGDDLSYRFAWRVNGSSAGDGGPELSRRSFHRGDRIELWVVASDGQDESERFEIEPIPIVNSPPEISSTPAGSSVSPAPGSRPSSSSCRTTS